ncbi:MAG TPA: hypothetical protein VK666_28235 [Chryseolinea sp.]|nr:hypothetical protein [Chryseolinea sp.]
MKNFILPILFLGAMACTQTEYIDVVKTIHDTVKVNNYIDRVFQALDTVETIIPRIETHRDTVVLHDTVTQVITSTIIEYDTIVTVDSVFVERTVNHYDTIYTAVHHYGDTLYILFGRSTYSVPQEVQWIVTYFYSEAQKRGLQPPGGTLTIDWWKFEEAPTDWSSFTVPQTLTYGWRILLRDNIPNKYLLTPVLREMARNQLGKRYTTEDDIMNPQFPPDKVWQGSANEKEYLDKLFQ